MSKRRDDALRRHWDREVQMFGLKPHQYPPCLAIGEPPTGGTAWDASWPLARARRLQLLAQDAHYYDDIDAA